MSGELFHISKEHQITTEVDQGRLSRDCFTFQKSIKSQHHPHAQLLDRIVSHFKRASNQHCQRATLCCIIPYLLLLGLEDLFVYDLLLIASGSNGSDPSVYVFTV